MFKRILRNVLFLLMSLSCTVSQAEIPNYDDPVSYVGTTGKAKYSKKLTENSAFSLLGEAGPRNYRAGATLGWLIQDNQRLKISGEFLQQNIEFAFFSGNSREWVKQGAIGAHYQYDLYQYDYFPQFNLKGGYSHAPSKQLATVAGSFINGSGVSQNFLNERRIAGSDAGFVSPGLSIAPWPKARVGAELNYDNVNYDRVFQSDQRTQGFGGTANFNQQIGENIQLGLSAGVREPFNAYQANIGYTLPDYSDWTLGVDANYVEGKHHLPNSYNVGLTVSYALRTPLNIPDYLEKEPTTLKPSSGVTRWVAEPAIYLPQVLAITDEKITSSAGCFIPSIAAILPDSSIETIGPVNINLAILTAPYFASLTPITYSLALSPAVPDLTEFSIDPVTGVITVNAIGTNNPPPPVEVLVTVTATNSCGAVSQTFVFTHFFD